MTTSLFVLAGRQSAGPKTFATCAASGEQNADMRVAYPYIRTNSGHFNATPLSRRVIMTTVTSRIAIALIAALALSSCANTIRGVGKDASNTVDATKNAADDVAN